MNDQFNENQNAVAGSQSADEQATRMVEALRPDPVRPEPVQPEAAEEAKPTRRRRTERFAGLIEDEPLFPQNDSFRKRMELPPIDPDAKKNVDDQKDPVPPAAPVRGPWQRDSRVDANAFAGVRVPPRPMQPSQGVPRPAALSGQAPHREQAGQTVQTPPVVRRPVNAEGYTAPLQQLGKQ